LSDFTEHLGKARADRIRYHQAGGKQHKAPGVNIPNTVIQRIQNISSAFDGPIENILHTACIREANRIPLNTGRLLNVLQCITLINTREVQTMMNLDKRQASEYVRAAKFAIPFIEKAFPDDS